MSNNNFQRLQQLTKALNTATSEEEKERIQDEIWAVEDEMAAEADGSGHHPDWDE
jgi:pterin-4a-carbinolamine dehydratase